jgi:TetR/AcrR family transcriptional regulator, transcriptional repressor for nem operon
MQNKDTRQKLIDVAYEEIYSKGYQGASLNDILKNAGVHKGSMYYFFASKKELAIASITEKMSVRFEEKYGLLVLNDDGVLKKLISTLKDTSIRDFNRGCPLLNLVQEMSNLDKDFDLALKAVYAKFKAVLKSVLDKAVELRELKPCDTMRLASFIIIVVEGAIFAAKASGDENEYVSAIEELSVLISSLSTKR